MTESVEKREPKVKPDARRSAPIHEPGALSTEYHKAHKQLMLWSAILFIWELVGVDLDKAREVGGNVGAIVTALKSPQAVPWALLCLVGYFLFKCSIEWGQCHPDRRKLRFARADFISAWIVAVAAISLYVGQRISHVQFANAMPGSSKLSSLARGAIIGYLLVVGPSEVWGFLKQKQWGLAFGGIIILVIGPSLMLRTTYHSLVFGYFLTGALGGLIVGLNSSFGERLRNLFKK